MGWLDDLTPQKRLQEKLEQANRDLADAISARVERALSELGDAYWGPGTYEFYREEFYWAVVKDAERKGHYSFSVAFEPQGEVIGGKIEQDTSGTWTRVPTITESNRFQVFSDGRHEPTADITDDCLKVALRDAFAAGPMYDKKPKPKQLRTTAALAPGVEARKSHLDTLLQRLLKSRALDFDISLRSNLPEGHGIYRVFVKTDPRTTLRAGRTISAASGLRQRVYQNHFMGSQKGNLRQQLVDGGLCDTLEHAKRFIVMHCQVQVLQVDDAEERKWLEYYMLSVLRPKYCD